MQRQGKLILPNRMGKKGKTGGGGQIAPGKEREIEK